MTTTLKELPCSKEELQELIDVMKKMPQYRGYIRNHNLGLLNSQLKVIDELLDNGELQD